MTQKKTRRKYPILCHPNRKHAGQGLCGACFQHFRLHKDKVTPRVVRLKEIVRGHEDRKNTVSAEWSKTRPAERATDIDKYRKKRDRSLRDRYGITLSKYEELLRSQCGVCAICAAPPKNKPLYVDHCHRKKHVRGILCAKCNLAAGVLEQSPDWLAKVKKYLEETGSR